MAVPGAGMEKNHFATLRPASSKTPAGTACSRCVPASGSEHGGAAPFPYRFCSGDEINIPPTQRNQKKSGPLAGAWLFHGLFGTPDQREGMAAFLEKRAPRFQRD